jgi:hypothetical protein
MSHQPPPQKRRRSSFQRLPRVAHPASSQARHRPAVRLQLSGQRHDDVLVKHGQGDIGQQRRENPPCRVAGAEISSVLAMATLIIGRRSAAVTGSRAVDAQGSALITARGSPAVLFRFGYLGVTNALALLRLLPMSDRAQGRRNPRAPAPDHHPRTARARREDPLHPI